MLLKIIDAIQCPICKTSRLWKLNGDFTDLRIANGTVVCPQDHHWTVTEDVFRVDKENSTEEMQFLSHNITGFPSKIGEKVRGNFILAFNSFIEKFVQNSTHTIVIIGSPILFMKALPNTDLDLVIVNPSEGILRQVQEIAVSKRVYKQLSVIRAENIDFLLPDANILYIFDVTPDKLMKNEKALFVHRDVDADIVWEEESSILMVKK